MIHYSIKMPVMSMFVKLMSVKLISTNINGANPLFKLLSRLLYSDLYRTKKFESLLLTPKVIIHQITVYHKIAS